MDHLTPDRFEEGRPMLLAGLRRPHPLADGTREFDPRIGVGGVELWVGVVPRGGS